MKARITKIQKLNSKPACPFTHVHVGARTMIPTADIIYISADINYSEIYLTTGQKLLTSTNLSKLDQRFEAFPNMVRVHRSYLINTQHLRSIENNQAVLINNAQCSISRRQLNNLLEVVESSKLVLSS
jgi:DNA-binding LytR/AlgR family response regulator